MGNRTAECQGLLTVVHHSFSGSNEAGAVKGHEKNDHVAQHGELVCFLDPKNTPPVFPWWQFEKAVDEEMKISNTLY